MRVLFLSSPLFLLFLFFFFSGEGNGMITDPLYRSQWHYNPDERFGIHYHIDQFKKIGLDGSGVLISITVDSVAERNRDIAPRLNPSLSKTEWASTLEDRGNSIVSLAVADANQFCSIGIASGAEIGLQEAESDLVSVIESFYFRQWEVFDIFLLGGEVKPTRDLSAPPDGTISILRQVASEGRQGKGGIVVGPIPATRAIDGHCSTDQFLSQREVIAVASVSKDGEVRDAPKCAKYLVTAPTQVVTTVNDKCPSDSFDDPQAPAAIVAGAIALLLQLSPELQWYEVQQVLIESAMGVPGNIPFDTNAAGKRFSYDFGFGFLNVDDALNYLSLYTTAREPFIAELQYSTEGSMHIPEGEGTSPLIIEFEVEESPYPVLNAMLTLDVNHPQPTDLSFSLLSPSGTTVSLLPSGRGVTTFETNRVQFGGTGFYFSITSVFPTGNVEAPLVEIVRTIGNCCKANYKKCKIDDTIQLTTTRVAILMENNEKCNIEKQLTVVEGLPGDLQIEIVIFPYEALPGVAQITKPYPVVSGLTEIGFSSLDTLDFMANSEYDLSVKFNFVATKKGDAWPTPAFYRNLQLSTLYFYGERAPGKWRAVISDDLEYDVGLIKTATLSLTVTSTMRIIPPSPTPSPTPSPSPIPSSSPFPTPSPSPFTPPSPSPSPNPSSSPTPHPSPSPAPTPPAPTPSFSPSPSPFPAPSPSPTPTPTPTPSPSPAPVQEHFCGFYPEYDCNACDHCCTGLSEEECNICVAEFCEEKKKPEKKSNVMVGVVIFGCVALAGTGAVLYYLYPAMVISYSQRAFAFVQSSFERLVEKVREKMGSGGDKRDKKRKRDRERAENEELIEDDIDFDGYSSDDDGEGIGEGRKEKELEKEEESDEEEDEGDSDDDSEDDSDEDSDEEGSKKCLIS